MKTLIFIFRKNQLDLKRNRRRSSQKYGTSRGWVGQQGNYDVNSQNERCVTKLHIEAWKGDLEEWSVSVYWREELMSTFGGWTAIFVALAHDNVSILKMLLEAGAEVDAQDNNGTI